MYHLSLKLFENRKHNRKTRKNIVIKLAAKSNYLKQGVEIKANASKFVCTDIVVVMVLIRKLEIKLSYCVILFEVKTSLVKQTLRRSILIIFFHFFKIS